MISKLTSPLLLILQFYLLFSTTYRLAYGDDDDDFGAFFRQFDSHFDIVDQLAQNEKYKNDPNYINCGAEARDGKCWKNFTVMQANCKEECAKWQKEQEKRETFPIDDENESFYDLSAKTMTGKEINFERFEGYVTIIVNTAKICEGELEDVEGYLSALEQIRNLSPISTEVVVFPFEYSELEYEAEKCASFEEAAAKPGRPIHIMEETKINGPDTHPVYQFLKKTAGIDEMNNDIPTYFVVSAEGVKLEVHQTTMINAFLPYMRHRLKKDFNELKIDCDSLVKEEKCWKNPKYMNEYCEKECDQWRRHNEKHDTFPIDGKNGSFYDLSAKSIKGGKKKSFKNLKGKVTIIYNTPKLCKKKTVEEIQEYLSSIEKIRDISKKTDIEVLVFPFELPNEKYTESECALFDYHAAKPERTIRVMEMSKINGPDTHPVYQFLKTTAGIDDMESNRPTFFVVSKEGDKLEVHRGTRLGNFKLYMSSRLENDDNEL